MKPGRHIDTGAFVVECEDCGYSSETESKSEAERYKEKHREDHNACIHSVEVREILEIDCENCGYVEKADETSKLKRYESKHLEDNPDHNLLFHFHYIESEVSEQE
jgi:DNA-directed RNA polymerase subunit M/transcription elongation factor TFIIS